MVPILTDHKTESVGPTNRLEALQALVLVGLAGHGMGKNQNEVSQAFSGFEITVSWSSWQPNERSGLSTDVLIASEK